MAEAESTWINREFLEKALKSGGQNPDLTVVSCKVEVAMPAGTHYGSELYRATLQVIEDGKPAEKSVIIKCRMREEFYSRAQKRAEAYAQELKTLELVHPKMLSILRGISESYQPFAAKCLYLHKESPHETIVMEDLNREGFQLANINLGLDLKHCLLVVKTIAQYHAASLVLLQKSPNCFQPFLANFINVETEKSLSVVILDNLRDCVQVFKKCPGYEEYPGIMHSLEKNIVEKMLKANRRDETGYNVLNHGELWMHNIMFRYDDLTQEVQDVRFLDFQQSYYASPVVDLHYFLNSSGSPEVLEEFDMILEEYHNTLCETLSKLGFPNLQPTMDMLISEWNRRCMLGIAAGVTIRAFALSGHSHVQVEDNVVTRNESYHLSDNFQEAIMKTFPLYRKWGWF